MVLKREDRIIVVGDLHLPYVNKKALKWAIKTIKDFNPTKIIQIGDLYDFYHFSTFRKDITNLPPEKEFSLGRCMAGDFWTKVQQAAPGVGCYQMLGNHDERPYKRLLDKLPEMSCLVDLDNTLFSFPEVQTIFDPKQELVLKVNGKQVLFHHGYLTRLGAHMQHNQMRVAVGHTHWGGVSARGLEKEIHWELNAGFLGDINAGPLQYGPQRRHFWPLGIGAIDKLGPRFLPYGG